MLKRRLNSPSLQSGFSLIEVMIVLIIIGLFMTVGARKFVNRSTEMKSAVRKFSAVARKLRNKARINNRTYRLVFDLPQESNKQQSYWIEATDKTALLLNSEQREELSEALEQDSNSKERDENQPPPDPQGFAPDSEIIKQSPATLPDGLYFESVELDGDPVEKVDTGRVYIYFFPQGYVQASAIHLTNRDSLNWTLVIRGLTGQVDIYTRYRSLSDFKE